MPYVERRLTNVSFAYFGEGHLVKCFPAVVCSGNLLVKLGYIFTALP